MDKIERRRELIEYAAAVGAVGATGGLIATAARSYELANGTSQFLDTAQTAGITAAIVGAIVVTAGAVVEFRPRKIPDNIIYLKDPNPPKYFDDFDEFPDQDA